MDLEQQSTSSAPPPTAGRWIRLGLAALLASACSLDLDPPPTASERAPADSLNLMSATAAGPSPSRKPKKIKPRITGGYVLTHEHPTNGMAFGGNYAFAGSPGNYRNGVMERGYTQACGGCQPGKACDHGEVKGNITAALGALGSDMGDHRSHMGPLHDSNSHLRYSTEWIKAAYDPAEPELRDTRLKIMVAFAVESEAMCEQLYHANKGNGGAGGGGYPCSRGDTRASMDRQIKSLKRWAKANSSWMAVAYSAADARRIVTSGKLAVVLGVESDYAFGAEDRTFDPVKRLRHYHDLGVRTFYLAHKVNSRLAGADIYRDRKEVGGRVIRATQALAGCFYVDDAIAPFPLKNKKGHEFCDNKCGPGGFKGGKLTDKCVTRYSELSEVNYADYTLNHGDDWFNGFDAYPPAPGFSGPGGSHRDRGGVERNHLGLSHDGERVVREAMRLGMIVNIDHVSSEARAEIAGLSRRFGDYPLNALHNNPNALLKANKLKKLKTPGPNEFDFDDTELEYVARSGGFFGVRVGPLDAKNYRASGVTTNCPKTATETAKILAYLIDKGLTLGYGLDYATITEGVHSRTLRNCGRQLGGQDFLHRYGNHAAEGLTHVGMMKYWHRELEAVGLDAKYLTKLKNDGPEAFVQMWERSERKGKKVTQIPRQTFPRSPRGSHPNADLCQADGDCPDLHFCGNPVLGKRTCKPLKAQGQVCTRNVQCESGRCAGGKCGAADECSSNADCGGGQFCGDPVLGRRSCKPLRARGQTCTKAAQCQTGRCAWGVCADADECRLDSDCTNDRFCGDPVLGKRTCKPLRARGQACTRKSQCATDRCAWGVCAAADECRDNGDCSSSQYCGDPIGGKRSCKALKGHGQGCTKDHQCSSDRCAWGRCAHADECRSHSDCRNSEYCGNPVAGADRCKPKKAKGKGCTKAHQCQSGKCRWGTCK